MGMFMWLLPSTDDGRRRLSGSKRGRRGENEDYTMAWVRATSDTSAERTSEKRAVCESVSCTTDVRQFLDNRKTLATTDEDKQNNRS